MQLIILIGFCLPNLMATSDCDLSIECKTKRLETQMDNLLVELDRFQTGVTSCREFLEAHEATAGATLEELRVDLKAAAEQQRASLRVYE